MQLLLHQWLLKNLQLINFRSGIYRYIYIYIDIHYNSGSHYVAFHSAGGQNYTLAAADTEKAHSWIRRLQDKREQWIHRDAAEGKTDLDRQAKKRTLQPYHDRPGVLLPTAGM